MKELAEMDCRLRLVHLGLQGVTRTGLQPGTLAYWLELCENFPRKGLSQSGLTVLTEAYPWNKRFYNALMSSNSIALSKVLQVDADIMTSSLSGKYQSWTIPL
eukprot:1160159-Pelagomonas_calceolata.AAC.5